MTIFSYQKDWGEVEKCPHCPAKNIKRRAKNQITCGSAGCQKKAAAKRGKRRDARNKGK